MTGADYIAQFFKEKEISLMTGIPGGANIALFDALSRAGIKVVLSRHEQGAGFIAQGQARISKRPAVCLASSGPGATNLITALADAKADYVPIFAITGQVKQCLLGSDAFQEADMPSIAESVTIAVRQPKSIDALIRDLHDLWEICADPVFKGPVLLDICQDLLNVEILPSSLVPERKSNKTDHLNLNYANQYYEAASIIQEARYPLIISGKGACDAQQQLKQFADLLDAPICHTLPAAQQGICKHKNSIGMMGSHGHGIAEEYLAKADCIIAIGQRFDDRALPKLSIIPESCKIIHINRDISEKNKRVWADIFIQEDAAVSLDRLLSEFSQLPDSHNPSKWTIFPRRDTAVHPIHTVFTKLANEIPSNAIIVTDVGQHQVLTARHFPFQQAHDFLTSSTFGTMGFGLPTAIGVALACKEAGTQQRPVWLFSGDGSMLMNVQELSLLAELQLDISIVVFNNSALGLVREQQYRGYNSRFAASEFQHKTSFVKVARAFGIESGSSIEDLKQRSNKVSSPYLLELEFSANNWSMIDTPKVQEASKPTVPGHKEREEAGLLGQQIAVAK